ncbi:MAG: 16S rRNA (uracil(1498)-N(3))-methyltransferase [Lachnospiraceae bacterium]|nr:16S rRNA (uracil(1498)-N(3))-methyltransferase [Lachnospiraceae bacterium]
MNQFFIEPSAVAEGKITITGEDVNHIVNVLRMRKGESLSLVESVSGLTYFADIESMDQDGVVCVIQDVQSESRELPVKVTIYQGMPKSDKLEFVIQKSVEMGAARIVPVAMKRSVVKLDQSKTAKKCARWNSIAESAASQSKRGVIPEVTEPMSLKEAIKDAESCDAILLPYELAEGIDETRKILTEIRDSGTDSIAVFIGPEGGFDESEVKEITDAGGRIITLGNRILRTETAPIAILAWLTYLFEK